MTEVERQDFRAAVLHYRGIPDAEPQPNGLGKLREREIRRQTVERVVAMLTKNARDPVRIGKRVLVLEWLLQDEKNVKSESQKTLAVSLDVTEGRVSQLISAVGDGLVKIRNDGEEIS